MISEERIHLTSRGENKKHAQTGKRQCKLVGFIDWELEKFHGDDYSIMNGSSQNAYLLEKEKTVLIDTIPSGLLTGQTL